MAETLLELRNICAGYAGERVLHHVDLTCYEGQIISLLGANGAGKSSLLKTMFGLVPLQEGTVSWKGRAVRPTPADMIQDGLSFVPQGRSVFPNLTVRENLEVAVHFIRKAQDMRQRLDEVVSLFPALTEKWNAKAGTLSGGQQQMVVLARGLMTRPKLLLLDEPSIGLAPRLVKDTFDKVKEINIHLKTAFIIVEHNLKSLLHIVDQVYVLHHGRVMASGPPAEKALQDIIMNIFKLGGETSKET